ncbi:MAG: peptidylprolyl isomerase [Ferruginibacter sp.]
MRSIFLSFICVAFCAAAFAQPQKVTADKIIAVVGDKIILRSDVDNYIADMQRQGVEVPPNARCAVLEQSMGVKALVLQAEKDSLPVTDEEIDAVIENKIRYFISAYGSKEELEKIAGKSVYQLKADFKDGVRDQKLAEAMRNKIVENIKITPKETQDFFNKIPKDSLPFYESEMEISQIVIYPKASRDAEEYVQEQLKEFKTQVESGKKDFKTLASIYSADKGTEQQGGTLEINRNQKELDPVWLNKAFSLKPGQISNPFKTRFGYHIILMVSRAGDDAVVRHILLTPQITETEISATTDKLDSVRSQIMSGNIKFNEGVTKYSEDEATKYSAGAITNKENGSPYITIDQLDAAMVTMLKSLKVGQYSAPVKYADDRGKQGVRIVYLKTKSEPHRENLTDDYNRISQKALEEKKGEALEHWFATKLSNYYIMVDDEYKSCEEMKKWVSAANTASKN